MAKAATSPQRSRRASSGIPGPSNHSIESAEGEEESFEVTASSKKLKGNDGLARPAPPASKSPSLSPVPSSSPLSQPEELPPAGPVQQAAIQQPEVVKALDICPVCYNVPEAQRKRDSTSQENWVACEQCEQWYHWCVAFPIHGSQSHSLIHGYCHSGIVFATAWPRASLQAIWRR